ncbi:hypothetical protein [Streptomyces sp. NPDC057617]|uniref:hypothetical protein n=1 Tax=Streptomyces sp. NPDC057617 TaxID=3346184 RepID=UPI0036791992
MKISPEARPDPQGVHPNHAAAHAPDRSASEHRRSIRPIIEAAPARPRGEGRERVNQRGAALVAGIGVMLAIFTFLGLAL